MSRELAIDGISISQDTDCYIIAEIGNNHQGSVQTCMDMFKVAKECGADAVKLQKRDNKSLYTGELYDSAYASENAYGATYGEHREALEFGKPEYLDLMAYAKELGITMFATAFDFKSADFLADINAPAFKIASGDLTSIPLLKHVAQYKKPIVLSTGGGTMDDVKRAHDAIMPINPELCILQCTAAYPIYDYKDMNLGVIPKFMEEFPDNIIGSSDHESGIAMALAAYVLGARVVEKHFTLNRSWRGTDHAFSLSPPGLKNLCRDLRRARSAIGDGVKSKLSCEEKPLFKMAKKLVAARDLSNGTVISADDVTIKSPGDGLLPYEMDKVLGKTLGRDMVTDEGFALKDLK